MLYEIKNKKHNDITIGTKTLKYNDTMIVKDLEPLKKLIDLNYIEVIYPVDKNIINITETRKLSQPFIEDEKKSKLIESFFNFYLNKDISSEDLNLLKWFYKNIGFTNVISQETLILLDGVQNQEELIEILLNNIYPELFDQYTLEEKDK